jgi:[calcium/calmodulin-dependent protein kinase] kinase
MSDVASPISSVNLGSSQERIFPSVPSLPALISGASSVSADAEGDFLQRPGFVKPPEAILTANSTPDTLTPPPLSKQPSAEGDTPTRSIDLDALSVCHDLDEEGYNGDGDLASTAEDDDSDSDEGLTMTRRKPKPKPGALARRGTNISVESTETAK